jgi:membrane protein YdbS with pleckstrin-like domain
VRKKRAGAGGAPGAGPGPGGAAPGAGQGGTGSAGRVLLADGERLAIELRSHWYRLLGPVLVLFVTTGAASYLAATVPESEARPTLRWIIAGTAAVIVLRWSVWPYLVWYAHSYLLTTRRFIIREGVLARRGHDIPLGRIVEASFSRTLLQRMLGCGRLEIQTAGQRGLVVIDDVPLVEDVQRAIYGLVAAAPPTYPPAGQPGARPAGGQGPPG